MPNKHKHTKATKPSTNKGTVQNSKPKPKNTVTPNAPTKAPNKPKPSVAQSTKNGRKGTKKPQKPMAIKPKTSTPIKNKNKPKTSIKQPNLHNSKTKPSRVGATLSTTDNLMTNGSKKKKRWLAVIEQNSKDELGVVSLESEKRKNNALLKDFMAGNKRSTYYSTFLEIEDAQGESIKVNEKFNQNNNSAKLNQNQINAVRNTLYKKSNKKIENLAKRNKLLDK